MRDRQRPCLLRAVAACLLCCLAGACLAPPAECSGSAASLEIATPQQLHLRVRLVRDGATERHEVVVRAERGRIEAVGLLPVGTQVYRLVHDASGVRVENRIGRHLGLSPRLAYDAIARAYLAPGLPTQRRAVVDLEEPGCGYAAHLVLVTAEPLSAPAPDAPRRP